MKAEIPVSSTDSSKLGNDLKISLVLTKWTDPIDQRWAAAGAEALALALGLGSRVERAGGSLTDAAQPAVVD